MKVSIANSENWTALYIDGKKVLENHSLTVVSVLRACGLDAHSYYVDEGWLEKEGRWFPELEKEVVPEK